LVHGERRLAPATAEVVVIHAQQKLSLVPNSLTEIQADLTRLVYMMQGVIVLLPCS
jgi:hypothetical protein